MRRLNRTLRKYPYTTAQSLKLKWPKLFGHISCRTIQRLAREKLGIPIRRAAQKPLLTKRMIKQRLQFCLKYKNWDYKKWRKVMFSDESQFYVNSPREALIRRPKNVNRYDTKFCKKSIKYPAKVMVWGCFSGGIKVGRH